MKLGELFYELGFKADNTTLNDFIKSIGTLDMSSIMAGAGVGALYEMMRKVTETTRESGMELAKYGIITGMSAQQMSSWTKAAEQAGVEGDVVKQTFMSLQEAQQRARMFGLDQNVSTGLAMIQNIGKVKDPLKAFYGDLAGYQEMVAKGIEGVSAAQQRQILGLLGINEQMLIFYKSRQFSDRNNQDVFGDETISQMQEITAEWARFNQEMKMIGATFAKDIAPVIIGTTRTLVTLLDQIRKGFIGKTLSRAADGWGMIGEYVQAGLDWTTTEAAKLATMRYRREQPTPSNINATFHFSHVVGPEEMKEHALYALREAVREAHNKLPATGY